MSSFLIGTAPFCSPDREQCYATPGYKPEKTEKDGCLFGNKIRCSWNNDTWKNSGLYNQLSRDGANMTRKPVFKWFGLAPLCIISNCDVAGSNYIPIGYDLCGDGSCCTTSEKILGMQPMSENQKQLLKDMRHSCGFK